MNIIKRILQTVAVVLGGLVSLSFPAQACDPMSADCLGGWAYADGIFDPQGIAPSAQSLLAIDDIDDFKSLDPAARIGQISASSRPSEMWHYRGNMLGWGAKRDGSHASGYQHGRAYPVTGQVTLNFYPESKWGGGNPEMRQYYYGMRIYRGSPHGAMLSPDGRSAGKAASHGVTGSTFGTPGGQGKFVRGGAVGGFVFENAKTYRIQGRGTKKFGGGTYHVKGFFATDESMSHETLYGDSTGVPHGQPNPFCAGQSGPASC